MAEYFVSQETGASDSNAGTSQLLPWLTVAKINSSSFNAGDIRYLKRGGLWREQLLEPSAGSSGTPIVLQDYGNVAVSPPVLDGSTVVTGFASGGFTTGANNVTNPGFETDTSGWTTPFATTATITRDTSQFYAGAASGLAVRTNTNAETRFVRYAVPSPSSFTSGNTYIVQARVKMNAAIMAAVTQVREFQGITFVLETDGTFSATTSNQARAFQRIGDWQGGSDWLRLYLIFDVSVTPTATFNVNFQTLTGGADANGHGCYIDELEVRRVTAGTMVYSVTPGFTPLGVWLNDTTGLLGGLDGVASVRACENLPGTWYTSGGVLYVHLIDEADPSTYTVEVAQRSFGWRSRISTLHPYLTVKNIEARHCGDFGFNNDNCNGVSFIGLRARNNVNGHIRHDSGSATVTEALTQYCVVGKQDRPAIGRYDTIAYAARGCPSAVIERNYAAAVNGQALKIRLSGNGTIAPDGATIRYNDFGLCYSGWTSDGSNITHVGNYYHDGYGAGMQPGVQPASAPGLNQSFVRNVLFNIRPAPDDFLYNGFDSNGSSDGFLYHNTLIQVSVRSATFEEGQGIANDNWTIKNNIFDAWDNYSRSMTSTSWGGPVYIYASATGCVFDYNIYREVNTGGSDRVVDYQANGIKTWAQWQGTPQEAHGLNTSPLMDGLGLTKGSPCREAGVVIAGINDGTANSPKYNESAPDIGAIEWEANGDHLRSFFRPYRTFNPSRFGAFGGK